MKRIAIIGASAGVGLETTRLALQKGHEVTTLSRNTPELLAQPNLHSIVGSALVLADCERTVLGADVIIVTLGTGTKLTWNAITKGTTLYSQFANLLVKVLETNKLSVPLIVVTGFGAGDSKAHVPFPLNLFMRTFLKKLYEDKTRMEEIITNHCSRWTIVRPTVLVDKPATGSYHVYDSFAQKMEANHIARTDVACFLVNHADNFSLPNRYVTLTGGS